MPLNRVITKFDQGLLLSGPARIICFMCVISSWHLGAGRLAIAQILPLKSDVETDTPLSLPGAANSPSVVENDSVAVPLSDLPVWERRFFKAIDRIDAAIATAEEETTKASLLSSNPLVREDAIRQAKVNLDRTLRGIELGIHFRLADIKPGKARGRDKQEFELTLQDPTFPAHAYLAEVTVVISPQQARRLEIGDVIRAEGQLMEKSRRSFDVITFYREAGTPLLAGEQQKVLRSYFAVSFKRSSRQTMVIGEDYRFGFYVDNIRPISGALLDEYTQFRPRYETRLQEYRPAVEGGRGRGPQSDVRAAEVTERPSPVSSEFP